MNLSRAVLVVLLASATAGAAAAEPRREEPARPAAEPVDAELLEFLGSLDTEEDGWPEFLEERPVRTATGKPAGKEPARRPAPQPAKDKQ